MLVIAGGPPQSRSASPERFHASTRRPAAPPQKKEMGRPHQASRPREEPRPVQCRSGWRKSTRQGRLGTVGRICIFELPAGLLKPSRQQRLAIRPYRPATYTPREPVRRNVLSSGRLDTFGPQVNLQAGHGSAHNNTSHYMNNCLDTTYVAA